VIFPRDDIVNVKQWPQPETAFCAPRQYEAALDAGCPCPCLVEVSGTPRGAAQLLTVLLALPKGSLAARLHDALAMTRRKPQLQVSDPGAQGAVRCELQINASLPLHSAENEVNCAAVVRRGICEACHVGSDRVWICRLHETAEHGGFSGGGAGRGPEDPGRERGDAR